MRSSSRYADFSRRGGRGIGDCIEKFCLPLLFARSRVIAAEIASSTVSGFWHMGTTIRQSRASSPTAVDVGTSSALATRRDVEEEYIVVVDQPV